MYQVFLGQKQASNDYYVMEKKKSKNYNPAASLFSSGINHFSLNVTKYNNKKKKQVHWKLYLKVAAISVHWSGTLSLLQPSTI